MILSVVDVLYGIVTFAIEWREEEDDDAEEESADDPFLPRAGDFLEEIFGYERGAGEVERGEAAEDAEQNHVGETFDGEIHGLGEVEEGTRAFDDIVIMIQQLVKYSQRISK